MLPDGGGGPHVFVADVGDPTLDVDDRQDQVKVLRLRDGDRLTVSDGAGRWRQCVLHDEPEPVGAVVEVAPPAVTVTIGFPPVKGDRPDWAVQKLTEIGVDRIVVLDTERGVVRWRGDRWWAADVARRCRQRHCSSPRDHGSGPGPQAKRLTRRCAPVPTPQDL